MGKDDVDDVSLGDVDAAECGGGFHERVGNKLSIDEMGGSFNPL